MYEHQLAAFHNGVTDIELSVTPNTTDSDQSDNHSAQYSHLPYNPATVSLTVTFAVGTDTTAWITVSGDGSITPAFGGTGTHPHELIPYVFIATMLGSLLFSHNVSWNYTTVFSQRT